MSLRIVSEASARNLERSLHTGRDVGGSLQDTYMTRMTKLVPAEAITTYPLILSPMPSPRPWPMVLIVAAVVLIVVIVLRWSATKGPDGKAQWPAVILSAVSFVIWVLVIGAETDFKEIIREYTKAAPWLQPQVLSSLALFAWTAVAPALYTGDRL